MNSIHFSNIAIIGRVFSNTKFIVVCSQTQFYNHPPARSILARIAIRIKFVNFAWAFVLKKNLKIKEIPQIQLLSFFLKSQSKEKTNKKINNLRKIAHSSTKASRLETM
jgi:hypothetical protein